MKIAVFGSNGFVGRNFVNAYRARGYAVLDPKRQELDLLDQEATAAYLGAHRPDVVVNCAVNINSAETNLNIYYNIERCSESFGRLVNIGSGAEYGIKHYRPMMTEDYFGRNVPSDIYGISKFCIAKDIERSAKDIVNLRVFGVFGEYEDHTRRFISNNICASIRSHTITVNRNSIFDYIDVMDLAAIAEKFFTLPAKYKSYNVCTGKPVALVDLAQVIDRASRRENRVVVVNGEINSVYTGSNERLLAEIGPFAFTPAETSVSRLFAWYEEQFAAGTLT